MATITFGGTGINITGVSADDMADGDQKVQMTVAARKKLADFTAAAQGS